MNDLCFEIYIQSVGLTIIMKCHGWHFLLEDSLFYIKDFGNFTLFPGLTQSPTLETDIDIFKNNIYC